jgi:hypothetical protein
MAFAPWLRLKLSFAFLASGKAARHTTPHRPIRPRPFVEQLEDRTLPSGGPTPQGPAAGPPPTHPPHQGPAAAAPPSPSNGGPGQSNPPASSPDPGGNGQGNGKGQGNGNGQGHANGPGAENSQPPPAPSPGPTANGQGNGNGQGNDQGQGHANGPGAENSQPSHAGPPGPGDHPGAPPGLADHGPGTENGPGNTTALAVGGAPGLPPESVPGAGPTGFGSLPGEALPAGEPMAVGALAPEGSSPISLAVPGNASPSGLEDGAPQIESALASAGLGGASLSAGALVPVGGGGYSALVTMLLPPSTAAGGVGNPTTAIRPEDLDSLFVEVWDADQLQFPQTLTPLNETLFPEGMPKGDERPSHNPPSALDDFYWGLGQPNAAPGAAPEANDAAAVGTENAAPSVAPEAVAANLAPFAPDSVRASGERLPILSVPMTGAESSPTAGSGDTNAKPSLVAALAPEDGHGHSSAALRAGKKPAHGDGLRPYHIALGMMPFLAAIGYTPASLRDHVRVGRRAWMRLRGQLSEEG